VNSKKAFYVRYKSDFLKSTLGKRKYSISTVIFIENVIRECEIVSAGCGDSNYIPPVRAENIYHTNWLQKQKVINNFFRFSALYLYIKLFDLPEIIRRGDIILISSLNRKGGFYKIQFFIYF